MRVKLLLLLLIVLAIGAGWAETLSFEMVGAKCLFLDTTPLNNQFALDGVTFSGGGTALNRCANFAVAPHSGTDLLAFHIFGYGTGPEVITFADPVSSVSIWVTSTAGDDTFRLIDNNGLSASVLALNSVWAQLTLMGPAFTQVTLSEQGGKYLWLADDLTWTSAASEQPSPVPEPNMLALMGTGFGLIGTMAKRFRG